MSAEPAAGPAPPPPCPVGGQRPLTPGEIALARTIFGNAIDYGQVTLRRRKWFPLQPRAVTMAPRGHLYFHPDSKSYCDDFSAVGIWRQGLLIHELTHVWQTQTRGDWYLILNRHPWCRYHYSIRPGWKLERYGIEQQAEIVKHAFWLRNGLHVPGAPAVDIYDGILPF